MAEMKYNVHAIAQSRSMSCWYASACMVAYCYEAGPRLGLPTNWTNNTGISVAEIKDLAKVEHLKFLSSATHEFTPASLIATLSRYGPLWAAGYWYGAPHVVVITGCDDAGQGTVYLNDPDRGVKKTGEMLWFNQKRHRGALLTRGYPPAKDGVVIPWGVVAAAHPSHHRRQQRLAGDTHSVVYKISVTPVLSVRVNRPAAWEMTTFQKLKSTQIVIWLVRNLSVAFVQYKLQCYDSCRRN